MDEDDRYLMAPCDCPGIYCERRLLRGPFDGLEPEQIAEMKRGQLELAMQIIELRDQLREMDCPQAVDDVP